MNNILQAYTGGFFSPFESSTGKIINRLLPMCKKTKAEAVLIGWNTTVPYSEIVSKLHENGRKVFLWLPVFSEYGEYAVTATDFLGEKHKNALSSANDDFRFACPSERKNIELAVQFYDRYFSSQGFDGIFLDKIRFSSFGNGFSAGMGCFCNICCDYYENEGFDINEFKDLMDAPHKPFLIPVARDGMRYMFENPVVDKLFRLRAKLITASVNRIADMFLQRGLALSLDVFAPPFAYLTGQDIMAMSTFADFIKPMIYRVTDAPAGIPYETIYLKNELAKNGCNIGSQLEKLWGVNSLADFDCLCKQLHLLKETFCDIYSGVEVNITDFCKTSKQYVSETKKAIKDSGIAGCVHSWNVLEKTVV